MTKQLTMLIFFLTCYLTSCGQTNNKNQKHETKIKTVQIDTSLIAILAFESTQNWVFKDSKPTEITIDDLLKIETILIKCINDYNPNQERQFKEIDDKHPEYKLNNKDSFIDLTRYKRQYVAAINSKVEKVVWVNCFCDDLNTNWRKELIIVNDGGNCYFNLKINLTTGQYYELMVNGDA